MELTDAIRTKILDAVRDGVPRRYAILAAGVPASVFREWLRRGRAGEESFLAFMSALKKAEADARTSFLSALRKHSKTNRQAADWLARILHERGIDAGAVPVPGVEGVTLEGSRFPAEVLAALRKRVDELEERIRESLRCRRDRKTG